MSVRELRTKSGIRLHVDSVRLRSSLDAHVVADVTLPPESALPLSDLSEGSPIQLTYGNRVSRTSVPLYVHAASRDRAARVIRMVGITWPMKSVRPRTFEDTTVLDIARRLADEYGLSVVLQGENRHISSFATVSSGWRALVDLAHLVGAHVVIRRGTLFLLDPVSLLKDTRSAVHLTKPTISKLGVRSERSEPEVMTRETTVLVGSELVRVTDGTSQLLTKHVPVATESPAELRGDLLGEYTSERWSETVSFSVTGDPRLQAGAVVALRQVANHEGYWVVQTADHRAKRGNYHVELTLSRFPSMANLRMASDDDGAKVSKLLSAPEPRLSNGRWVS